MNENPQTQHDNEPPITYRRVQNLVAVLVQATSVRVFNAEEAQRLVKNVHDDLARLKSWLDFLRRE